MIKEIWVVSEIEEHFSSEDYVSREDAIENGQEELNLKEGDSFFIGKQGKYTISVPTAQEFFQERCERDEYDLGDWSDHWETSFCGKKELHKKIDGKLKEIQELITVEHKVNFFLVRGVEQVETTQSSATPKSVKKSDLVTKVD